MGRNEYLRQCIVRRLLVYSPGFQRWHAGMKIIQRHFFARPYGREGYIFSMLRQHLQR